MGKIKDGVYYILRYRTKEFMTFIIIILVLILLSLMISYKDGKLEIKPSAEVKVHKGGK